MSTQKSMPSGVKETPQSMLPVGFTPQSRKFPTEEQMLDNLRKLMKLNLKNFCY